ncbi:acyl-CoA dehydrogenase family protein [Mycobacterium intracellulare]|uniref:acyl-CoA dehydrogenase family protein n=1 Tax=Mycobacterium intracellulare TaxID=1767 RepID=UPI00080B72BE|nr:acyl-CoA dehydrogenase family protein [Mycobacterium intracellulare]OCB22454.1 acyl-CoA dehydrogenase [Mycobacterium intracellulare subsp. yongonense]
MATSSPSTHQDAASIERIARDVVTRFPPDSVPVADLMGAWYDAGLSWVHFPTGLGGLDAPRSLQPIANRIIQSAGGPEPRTVNTIGYGIVAGTIRRYASPELAARLLRPLATGEEKWCQLFSEPGAGSDLAGLATRAVRDGDEWRVTGQKVWNSLAHTARWGVLLARTDPDAPKHKGITYFIVDMTAPGVTVRPLRQITGREHFNEVFLDDVRIPDSQRFGDVGAGWIVANSTLGDERTSLGDRVPARNGGAIGDAIELWHARPDRHTPVLREKLTRLWMRAETHRLTTDRVRVAAATREAPGPESAITKLVGSELTQHVYEFCMEFLGPEGTLIDTYSIDAPDDTSGPTAIQRKYLRSRATTIEGGTSEIQRTVIGERVLKLPQELRRDKNVPWRDIPR